MKIVLFFSGKISLLNIFLTPLKSHVCSTHTVLPSWRGVLHWLFEEKSFKKMQFFNYKVQVMAISNTKPLYFVDFLVKKIQKKINHFCNLLWLMCEGGPDVIHFDSLWRLWVGLTWFEESVEPPKKWKKKSTIFFFFFFVK